MILEHVVHQMRQSTRIGARVSLDSAPENLRRFVDGIAL